MAKEMTGPKLRADEMAAMNHAQMMKTLGEIHERRPLTVREFMTAIGRPPREGGMMNLLQAQKILGAYKKYHNSWSFARLNAHQKAALQSLTDQIKKANKIKTPEGQLELLTDMLGIIDREVKRERESHAREFARQQAAGYMTSEGAQAKYDPKHYAGKFESGTAEVRARLAAELLTLVQLGSGKTISQMNQMGGQGGGQMGGNGTPAPRLNGMAHRMGPAAPQAPAPPMLETAKNPQTGERLQYDQRTGQWVPIGSR